MINLSHSHARTSARETNTITQITTRQVKTQCHRTHRSHNAHNHNQQHNQTISRQTQLTTTSRSTNTHHQNIPHTKSQTKQSPPTHQGQQNHNQQIHKQHITTAKRQNPNAGRHNTNNQQKQFNICITNVAAKKSHNQKAQHHTCNKGCHAPWIPMYKFISPMCLPSLSTCQCRRKDCLDFARCIMSLFASNGSQFLSMHAFSHDMRTVRGGG